MADRLLVVGSASAHVALLTVFGVLVLHHQSALDGVLDPLGTATGFLIFGVVWAVAIVTHYYGLDAIDPWAIEDGRDIIRIYSSGFLWGAATGGGTFWILAIIVVMRILLIDPPVALQMIAVPTLLISILGTGISLALGGVVGILIATFDLCLLGIVNRIGGR